MNLNFKILLIVLLLSPALLCATPPIVDGLKSAVLPGLGEVSNGKNSGYIFMTLEATLWASMFYFNNEANLKIRQSEQFAINNANLLNYKINDNIWTLMEKFDRSGFESGGYNAKVVNDALEKYPNDRKAQTEYINQNKLSDDIYWDWENSDTRKEYQIFRKHSLLNKDYALVVSGVIIANHIFSFFNSIRISNQQNRTDFYGSFDSELNPYINVRIKF